ncbi:PAS-domain containing protein [Sinorhizobium sp. BG8]|uniref:PAS-domain containing protein n=1 Tax=Sinorhizobium sp. BG8 TaxID=2613773 RepID=UPI00193CF16B|nr:PAS-domain containing protein [Sinorhizobium sp. BG8]QRM56377.1 response regulator [Sinorhizobium sp. BG8]
MADIQDELLVSACEQIWQHGHPAYIKSSEMRFLAVNAAYASLFNLDASEIVGSRGDDIGETTGHEEREEHERRCLIFGSEETARYFHPFGGGSYVISMRRERLSEDFSILVGIFTPSEAALGSALGLAANDSRAVSTRSAHVRPVASGLREPIDLFAQQDQSGGDVPPESDPSVQQEACSQTGIHAALDVMGAGVAVFTVDNRLAYANRSMREFYRVLVGDAVDGPLDLSTIATALCDLELSAGPVSEEARSAWISSRMAKYDLPLFETVNRSPGGWMRLVTQRRPDGTLVALRFDVTVAKETEGRLQQLSQDISLYRALLDELPVASFVRDDQQRLIFANRAFLDLSGKSAEEILGKTAIEMYPDRGEIVYRESQAVFDTGDLLESEIEFARGDGSTVPAIARLCRVTTIDDKNYLIGSVTNTSVLKKREHQLIEAQQHAEVIKSDLENIVESLHVGVLVVDENDTIELVNGAFEGLWNDELPAIKGEHFDVLLSYQQQHAAIAPSPGEPTEDAQRRLQTIRSGNFARREVAYLNGRTLIEAGQPISNGRCLLTYIDITERREREREVLETRSALENVGNLMEDALSSIGQGLLIVDSGRVVLANEALHAMVDFSDHLLRPGADFDDIFRECEARELVGLIGDERIEARDFPSVIRPDRHVSMVLNTRDNRWLQLDATPTGDGRLVLVVSDITELKIREEQLQQLVVRAENADKAKSEFLANMSHEIRTPMNGVLGMAELLAKSDLDTRQKTFIDIIVKSGNALLTIINDILDFSKLDAGQMALRKVPFNVVEAVEDVASLLSAKAAEKDIELVVRGAAEMAASVIGDAGRFRQIVTNLVGNAVKFTDRGHVLIDMSATTDDEGSGVIATIRVEDSGAGIPADKLASIFDKFSQVDSSSTRRHEGTGLGLAITNGLVRLFGGTLEVESEVGKRSVFTVSLPMGVAQASPRPGGLPAGIAGARVLVIDQHEMTRDSTHRLLSELGFDATAVATGEEGIALLTTAREMGVTVDAVILDFQAGAGSASIVNAIREQEACAEVSIIALTSMNIPSDDKLFDLLDIQAHLMKPVRTDLLRETVCEVIRAGRNRTAIVSAPSPSGAVAASSPAATAEVITLRNGARAGVDVLVAEDNEVNQILFTQLLEEAGLSFHIVANGREAVEAYQSLKPGMILMDVSMPVMNGHQASREIRALEATTGHHVPIVAVTAHVLDGDREECAAAGMDDYLAKPISMERLEQKIRRWLDPVRLEADKVATLH